MGFQSIEMVEKMDNFKQWIAALISGTAAFFLSCKTEKDHLE